MSTGTLNSSAGEEAPGKILAPAPLTLTRFGEPFLQASLCKCVAGKAGIPA